MKGWGQGRTPGLPGSQAHASIRHASDCEAPPASGGNGGNWTRVIRKGERPAGPGSSRGRAFKTQKIVNWSLKTSFRVKSEACYACLCTLSARSRDSALPKFVVTAACQNRLLGRTGRTAPAPPLRSGGSVSVCVCVRMRTHLSREHPPPAVRPAVREDPSLLPLLP